MNIKCVIFDMDATLIDSEIAISNTINEVRADMQLPPLPSKMILEIINNLSSNALFRLYGVNSVSPQMRERFEALFNENYLKYAQIYKEAEEIVLWAKGKIKLAVATNAPQSAVNLVLDKLNLTNYFDFIIGASEKMPQKPDPTMLNLIKNEVGGGCVFLGDSKKDFLAAKNAKMPYIQVLWGRDEIILECQNCKTSAEVIGFIEQI